MCLLLILLIVVLLLVIWYVFFRKENYRGGRGWGGRRGWRGRGWRGRGWNWRYPVVNSIVYPIVGLDNRCECDANNNILYNGCRYGNPVCVKGQCRCPPLPPSDVSYVMPEFV